jgi:hypothetical protein
MVVLLREAGITGYYTTVMAGEGKSEADPDFPSDQANQVIVAVPTKVDTVWLECTNQTNPFGGWEDLRVTDMPWLPKMAGCL